MGYSLLLLPLVNDDVISLFQSYVDSSDLNFHMDLRQFISVSMQHYNCISTHDLDFMDDRNDPYFSINHSCSAICYTHCLITNWIIVICFDQDVDS